MATETIVIDSSLPIQDAFALMIDLARVPEWDAGISSSQLTAGQGGVAGALYEVTLIGFDRQPTTAIYELTAVEHDLSFTMVGTHPTFRAEDVVTFEATADGSRVTYVAELVMLEDPPPLSEAQLNAAFPKLVSVVAAGMKDFLNP